MLRKHDMRDNWVHNFVGYQKEMTSDVLLFVNINRNTKIVQLCGWLDKKNFLETADFYNKGDLRQRDDGTSFKTHAPLYEIQQQKLNKLNNINDLRNI
jgi:thioredoxin-related protein